MDDEKPTYEELEARLAVAERTLKAIRNEEIDALIGQKGVYLLRLKELEDALSESMVRVEVGKYTLDTLMECVPEGITIADSPDVRVRRVSTYGKQLLGKSGEELEDIPVEQHVSNWDIYEKDGKTPAKNESLPLTRAVQKGEIVKDEEWVLGKSDGSRIPVLCNAVPIRDGSGRITGGITVWRDISELKQFEETLRETNQELNEYAYALTHNLKAPLRAINNYVNFLHEDLAETLEGEPKAYLERLKDAIILSNKQFEDLETLYKVKKHPVNLEPFDMSKLLAEIQSIFKNTSDRKLIIARDWPVCRGGRFLIRQILIELITNGFKFNRADIKSVELGWQTAEENGIEIFVRDNGIGIEERYQQQIFDIFRRLHTEREFDGTGIGLAIVRRAVQRLGGGLRLEAQMDRGSTFYVRLPKSILEDRPNGARNP
jgi:PAS domain S-box-containing protein